MAKSDKPQSAKKRTKTKSLPTTEKTMTGKEMKKVKGGILIGLKRPPKKVRE